MPTNLPITRVLPALLVATLMAALGCQDGNGIAGLGDARGNRGGANPNANWVQEDRFGLPAIATVFIPTALKDAYNTAVPANDRAVFKPEVVSHLIAFGQSPAAADQLANALLPDIQPINTTQPTAFLNGRRLQDDVITAELGLIFGANAALNDDHVNANDKPFLGTFPYLATPWTQ
jgi:hypothetical protein